MATIKFLTYALGIGFSYLYFGILQEKITRTKHEPGSETFTCTMTLVLLQCVVNTLFAKGMLIFIFKTERDRTKSSYYGVCSLTYLTAMVASNMALRHVSYPTQVVGKSCKPIPIMILGVLIGRKRYTMKKYVFISMIVAGVALFMFKKNLTSVQESISGTNIYSSVVDIGLGELLLILSLSMDGVTGAVQERMKSEYQTKSGHMMYKMNLWSTFYLLIATAATGELVRFYEFIGRHPSLIYDIGLFSCLSAVGQLFIFLTVSEFGPLPCSIITTTRKFFTVLVSVFLFGNKLTTTQWIGTSLVFSGLALDAIDSKSSKPVAKEIKSKKKQ